MKRTERQHVNPGTYSQLYQPQCLYYESPWSNVRNPLDDIYTTTPETRRRPHHGALGTTTSDPLDAGDTAPETLEKNVNHPKRYTKGKIECIDALESAVVGKTPEEAICVANVIKYLWRYEEKEPLRSLKSAEWYLKRLISKYDHEANSAHHD